jgi:carbamoyl-phosphate synthase large subunit
MNILLTCAGRRSYLVEYFKEALNGEGRVHVANSLIDSTSMMVADRVLLTKSIYDSNYIEQLLEYCKNEDIELIISLFDLELEILARQKELFESNNIKLAISRTEVCKIANDKFLTQNFLEKHGFNTKPMFTSIDDAINAVECSKANFPFYIKPRYGMGSIGNYTANNREELIVLFKKVKEDIFKSYLYTSSLQFQGNDVIIQETLPGDEYGLDIINDFNENYLDTFVKKKISMRAGETDGAITVKSDFLVSIGEELSNKLKHLGILDVDVFYDGNKAYVLDINPRFGGGYPFSHLAGANIPKAYLLWSQNKIADIGKIEFGVKSFKAIHPIKM